LDFPSIILLPPLPPATAARFRYPGFSFELNFSVGTTPETYNPSLPLARYPLSLIDAFFEDFAGPILSSAPQLLFFGSSKSFLSSREDLHFFFPIRPTASLPRFTRYKFFNFFSLVIPSAVSRPFLLSPLKLKSHPREAVATVLHWNGQSQLSLKSTTFMENRFLTPTPKTSAFT